MVTTGQHHAIGAAARRDQVRVAAARLSLLVGLLMLALKMGAYLITGSAAILSDAMESVVHVGATLLMFFLLRLTMAPPDDDHPYGHGRAEHFSVGFEGGLVFLAGIAILWTTGRKLIEGGGYEVQSMGLGFAAVVAATVINLILGVHLVRTGKATGSQILVADGQHVLSDVWTSVAVAVGIGAVWLTGWIWLDAVIACAAAAWIMVEAWHLMRSAVTGLMDAADVSALSGVIEAINGVRDPAWMDIHSLRLRRAGDQVHVDLHMVVPAHWTVAEAHRSVDVLEEAVLRRLEAGGTVMVHLDHPPAGLGPVQLAERYPWHDRPFTLAASTRLTNDAAPSTLAPA